MKVDSGQIDSELLGECLEKVGRIIAGHAEVFFEARSQVDLGQRHPKLFSDQRSDAIGDVLWIAHRRRPRPA
jgi:hypothetical protein